MLYVYQYLNIGTNIKYLPKAIREKATGMKKSRAKTKQKSQTKVFILNRC